MKRLALILAILVLVAAVAIGVMLNQKKDLDADLKNVRADLTTQQEALTKAQQEAEEKTAALQTELDSAKESLGSVQTELEKAKTDLTAKEEALTKAQKEADDKIAALTTELDAAKADLEKGETELKEAQAKPGALQTLLDEALKDKEALTTKLAVVEKDLEKAQQDGEAKAGEIQTLLDGALAEKEELTTKLAAMEKDLEEALAREKDNLMLLEEAMADRDGLEAQLEELKQQAAEPAAQTAETAGQEEITVTKFGYDSPVAVTVTFDKDGAIVALQIGDEQFAETPGLGARVKEEAFINQFIGKVPPLSYEDEELDAITGASLTSKAVLDAINEAYTLRGQ